MPERELAGLSVKDSQDVGTSCSKGSLLALLFFLRLWAASERDGIRDLQCLEQSLSFLLSSSQHLANSCVLGVLSQPSCPAHDLA